MKTTKCLVISIVLILAFYTSCKKDNESPSNIVGKWKLHYTASSLRSPTSQLDTITLFSKNNEFVEFSKHGIVYGNVGISIYMNADSKLVYETVISPIDTGAYIKTGDLLVLTKKSYKDTLSIIKLTTNELILESKTKFMKDSLPVMSNDFRLHEIRMVYIK